MHSLRLRKVLISAAALSCLAMLAAPASGHAAGSAFGPPWISIETPVNPYDPATRGAFLVVHEFHHGTPAQAPLSGTAEGMVNGERRSVVLQFTPAAQPGAYALRKQWGDVGLWTLVITVAQHDDDIAQAIVELGSDGAVARIEVPTRPGERDMPLPRRISAREIDSALRLRARAAGMQRGE